MRVVPALDRGLRILDLVASEDRPVSASEIAARLRLPRSATYELIHTLSQHGVLEQDGGGFRLGRQLFILGSSYARSLDLIREATAAAEHVMQRCDETVQVGVLDGRHVLYVAKADSTRMLRLVSAVGLRLPAHCTALGKVLLASLASEERTARLKGVSLERLTPSSITNLRRLESELTSVREQGYAVDESESNPDICCVAAPVRDHQGTTVAAMSITVPVARFHEQKSRLTKLVLNGAAELSGRLGSSTSANGEVTTRVRLGRRG